MGLAIEICRLADLLKEDPEGASWLEEDLTKANRVLANHGLPPHTEPRDLPALQCRAEIMSFPYSFLHYLRRAYAYRSRFPTWTVSPLGDSYDPVTDRVLDEEGKLMKSHLLCHADHEGFYLPVDFREILFSDGDNSLPGDMLGSSFRLYEELVFVAPALGIRLQRQAGLDDAEVARLNCKAGSGDGLCREIVSWLALYEASRLSLIHRSAIVFS
jgi:hypothetical protein